MFLLSFIYSLIPEHIPVLTSLTACSACHCFCTVALRLNSLYDCISLRLCLLFCMSLLSSDVATDEDTYCFSLSRLQELSVSKGRRPISRFGGRWVTVLFQSAKLCESRAIFAV